MNTLHFGSAYQLHFLVPRNPDLVSELQDTGFKILGTDLSGDVVIPKFDVKKYKAEWRNSNRSNPVSEHPWYARNLINLRSSIYTAIFQELQTRLQSKNRNSSLYQKPLTFKNSDTYTILIDDKPANQSGAVAYPDTSDAKKTFLDAARAIKGQHATLMEALYQQHSFADYGSKEQKHVRALISEFYEALDIKTLYVLLDPRRFAANSQSTSVKTQDGRIGRLKKWIEDFVQKARNPFYYKPPA